jgi:hypothetical protein
MKSSVEPEDAAIVETPAVAETLTEEPESMEPSANVADVGLGKSVHEQVGSSKRPKARDPRPKAHDPQGESTKRASVVENVARRTGNADKE